MPHFIPLSISCSDNPNSTFVFAVWFRYWVAVSDKDSRRTQTDTGSYIVKHPLELFSAHADALSPFGRIRVIEGYIQPLYNTLLQIHFLNPDPG